MVIRTRFNNDLPSVVHTLYLFPRSLLTMHPFSLVWSLAYQDAQNFVSIMTCLLISQSYHHTIWLQSLCSLVSWLWSIMPSSWSYDSCVPSLSYAPLCFLCLLIYSFSFLLSSCIPVELFIHSICENSNGLPMSLSHPYLSIVPLIVD